MRRSILWPLAAAVLLLASLGLAQQGNSKGSKSQQKQEPSAQSGSKRESQPLFKNKLGYQSSKNAKESTTLAFNGVDPSGRVDKEMLAKVPSAADQQEVKKMDSTRPSASDLKAFLKEGGLNQK